MCLYLSFVSNGVNSATDLELYFNGEVIPHGSIYSKMNNITFDLDFSNSPIEYINQKLELHG